MSFNLLEEAWIPITYHSGRSERLPLLSTLKKSHTIRSFCLSTAADEFSLLRFILTLLYWQAGSDDKIAPIRTAFLNETPPENILSEMAKQSDFFDLFHPDQPFLQDRNAKKKKGCASFYAEMAVGTNIAHFHHGDDKSLCLCLACTAFGLMRIIPFSQPGGSGLTPSVHGAPPIMAMAAGKSLSETIGLNLIPLQVSYGSPTWSGCFQPKDTTKPIPPLEALTWNPRRILLPHKTEKGTCAYCGRSDISTVCQIAFEKNPHTKAVKKGKKKIPFPWTDPAAFYFPEAPHVTFKSGNEKAGAMETDLGVLVHGKKQKHKKGNPPQPNIHPHALVTEQNPTHTQWKIFFPCSNPANNKTYDHRHVDILLQNSHFQPISRHFPPNPVLSEVPKKKKSVASSQTNHRFLQAAIFHLSEKDWLALHKAAFRRMDQVPAAFDLFSAVYWGVRNQNHPVPPREMAWLLLKLMACVPVKFRKIHQEAGFNPFSQIATIQNAPPKKQGNKTFHYPLRIPKGRRLEETLRQILMAHSKQKSPSPIDWVGLADHLNRNHTNL